MTATVFVVGVSLALFVYWLRCTALLILRTGPTPEYGHKPAAANRPSLLEVRQQLYAAARTQNLAILFDGLQQEFKTFRRLVRLVGTDPEGYAKRCLLIINFRLMTLSFAAVHRFHPHSAKLALAEMSATVEYFAEALCRRPCAGA